MDALSARAPVHFYDTRRRVILCGLPGFEGPSTKHSRGVTCPKCMALLARPRLATAPSTLDAASGHAS